MVVEGRLRDGPRQRVPQFGDLFGRLLLHLDGNDARNGKQAQIEAGADQG